MLEEKIAFLQARLHELESGGWVWVLDELAERVEGGVPLERLLVEKWYPGHRLESERWKTARDTYCSGARRASVAVCGRCSCRPSFPNGTWVSPASSDEVDVCALGQPDSPRPCSKINRFSSVPSSLAL